MAAVSTLTDNFATQDAAKWDYGGSATATGGQGSIPCDNTFNNMIRSVGTYDFTGSNVFLELVQRANIGNGSTRSVFQVHLNESTDYMQFDLQGTQLSCNVIKASSATHSTQLTYNATTDRWLRLREAAGVVYFDTSADGVTWNNRDSATHALTVTAIGVKMWSAFGGTEPSPGTMLIDNLNVAAAGTSVSQQWWFM